MKRRLAIQGKPLLMQLAFLLLVVFAQSCFLDLYDFRIQEAFYEKKLIVGNILVIGKVKVLLFGALFAFTFGFNYFFPIPLKDIDRLARYLLITIIVLEAYTTGFRDYNHYYDSWFWADRILLFFSTLLVLYRPVFLPIFILQLLFLNGQVSSPPIVNDGRAHKSLVLSSLLTFWVFLVANKLWRNRFSWQLFIVFFLALVSTWYLQAGIGKFELNWHRSNNIYNLYAAAVDTGWLHFIKRDLLVQIGDFISDQRQFFQMCGIIIELILPLLLLINRKLTIACLFAFISLHTMIYLMSGIFFWEWIVMELVIVAVLISDKAYSKKLFQPAHFVAYFFLLLLLPTFTNPPKLAWLDCGYINSYSFFLVRQDGTQQLLYPSFFSPYDNGFSKNRFTYSRDHKFISNTFGQCNDQSVLDLTSNWLNGNDSENQQQIEAYRSSSGKYTYNKTNEQLLYHFLATFTKNKIAYDPKLISRIDFPLHMQQGDNQQNFQPIDAVSVKILYEEKVILPELKFAVVQSDSTFVSLKTVYRE